MPVNMLQEWLNSNLHRNYPLTDDSSTRSTTGTMLPSTLLADLSIDVAQIGEPRAKERFFISSVTVSGDSLQIAISYRSVSGTSFVCALSPAIPLELQAGDNVESRVFTLISSGEIPDTHAVLRGLTGQLIIGSCTDIARIGSLFFDYKNARILSTCVNEHATGVDSLLVQDSSGAVIEQLSGNFIIREGDGISLSQTQSGGKPVLVIRRVPTTAELNSAYHSVQDVLNAIRQTFGNPVYAINGIQPDTSGNITIAGADCTSINAQTSGISVSNTCSKPCCGEQDAADIAAALQSLNDAKTRLITYFETLSTNINAMQSRLSSLIASRK